MKPKTDEKEFWLATRDGEPCACFETRKEAVRWIKELLKQVLKDFGKQDTTDSYDYEIELKKIEIKRYKQRETFLGF